MSKARYQKVYTDKYNRDMDFVIVGDFYIGPFIDRASAEKSAGNINGNALLYRKVPTRTKIEHVEIPRESVDIELIDEVFIDEAGEVSVRDASAAEFFTCTLYRRIETPITELEEFIEKCENATCEHGLSLFGELYDAGCRFVGE